MTREGAARLANVLALLRSLATEVVVALDDRSADDADLLRYVAEDVVLFPHRDPGDSLIPWLHAQCSGGWILNLDDDEVPSRGLLEELPKMMAEDGATNWWLPRRWLYGRIETHLDEPPWVPDYQLRLYRNDPEILRFSDEFHRPVVVAGPPGFAHHPLWHLDCIVNPVVRRRAKAESYEHARRGMRVAGVAHNSGLYVPELRPGASTANVPPDDVELIRRVLEPVDLPAEPRGRVRRVRRVAIDALWPGEPFEDGMWRARLARVHRLDRLPAGARHTVTIAVENCGDATWRRGSDAAPLVQLATRWETESGDVEEGLHTPLPLDVGPGATVDVPVHVRAPERPGKYRLSVDLVHEHVRWFGCALTWLVEVTPAHRCALIGRGRALETALDEVHATPHVEPIVLESGAVITPERFGNRRAPGLANYLLDGIDGRIGPRALAVLSLRSARLLRRARRLRAGRPTAPLPRAAEDCLTALASCERLVVAGADWEPGAAPTRHLWRLAATAAAARRMGVEVEVRTDGIPAEDALDRLLERFLRRQGSRRSRPSLISHVAP